MGDKMKSIKAILTVINSRGDMYGNRYWAMYLTRADGKLLGFGSGYAPNLSWRDTQKLGWHVENHELPIREFNRRTKGWPYIGSDSEEMIRNLKRGAK